MKTIRIKIISLILFSTLFSSALIGVLLTSNIHKSIEGEVIEKYKEMLFRYSSEFDGDIHHVEEMANAVSDLISNEIDMSLIETDSNYMSNLKISISDDIKRIAESGLYFKSAYVFFSPELVAGYHDVWFADLNYDGNVTRQDEFESDFYESFNDEKSWFFIPLTRGESNWTDPYRGNADYDNDITYISFTMPIIKADEVIGIAGADFEFNIIEQRINDIKLLENGFVSLYNKSGEVIVHPELERSTSLGKYKSGIYLKVHNNMLSQDISITNYIDEKEGEMFAISKKLANEWVFVLSISSKEIHSKLYNSYKTTFLIVSGILILMLLISYKLSNFITNPINELTRSVVKLGNGDYSSEIPKLLISRNDETGKLASSFETMRLKQKESFDEITKHTEMLEGVVADRTKNLISTNQYLEEALGENQEKTAILEVLNDELESSLERTKETQEQLVEAEKTASMSFLIASIANEINTPIGSLVTLVSYLNNLNDSISKKYADATITNNDLKEFLQKQTNGYSLMKTNITSTTNLIDKFKQLDPYSYVYKETTINIKKFLELLIANITVEYDNKSIEIRLLGEESCEVRIDSGKLSQVLNQLIKNCLEHGFNDNTNEALVLVSYTLTNKVLKFSVSDNGVGMHESHIKSIFTPFYSSVKSGEKSGIGLNIAYNIVTKIFGGTLTCKSSINKGTEFQIEIKL